MPAIAFHVSCDDPAIERRIQDTMRATDRDDDTDELDDAEIERLNRRRTERVYFRTMSKSYVRK